MHLNPHAKCRSSRFNLKLFKKEKRGSLTEMVSYLHVLVNKIFDLEYFPESWSEGFIVPLHKKGSQDDVNNYRHCMKSPFY